jgi:hypothetical protein
MSTAADTLNGLDHLPNNHVPTDTIIVRDSSAKRFARLSNVSGIKLSR